MTKLKPTEPQSVTAHIVRRHEGDRYRVWFGERALGSSDSLTAARKIAAKSKAIELVECWETGKSYERSPRGAWKVLRKAA